MSNSQRIAMVAVGIVLSTGLAFAQLPTPVLQPAEEIATAVGTEAETREIVQSLLRTLGHLGPTIAMSAANTREAWLPNIPEMQFRRLDETTLSDYLESCEPFVWLGASVATDVLRIDLAYRRGCVAIQQGKVYTRQANGWTLERIGTMGTVLGHCGCPSSR